MAHELRRISFTAAKVFLRCQRQFYFRYVKGLILPPSGAQALGIAAERAITLGLRPVLQGRAPEPTDFVVEAFWVALNEESKEAIWYEEDPEAAGQDVQPALVAYWKSVAPGLAVSALQEYGARSLPEFTLEGYADLLTSDGIVDWKVSRRAYPAQEAQEQLWTYDLIFRKPKLTVHNLIRGGRVVELPVPKPSPAEEAFLLGKYAAVVQGIETSLSTRTFLPAPPSWVCTPKWCGYWDLCHKQDWRDREELGEAVERFRTRALFLPEPDSPAD